MEQGPGQGQPLPLSAGQIGPLALQGQIQAALAAEETGQVGPLQGGPKLALAGVGPGHQQVLPHSAPENPAVEAHIGHRSGEGLAGQGGQIGTAQGDLTGVATQAAGQDGGHGALAAAALAHNGGAAVEREIHVQPVEHLTVGLVGEAEPAAAQAALRGLIHRAGGLLRQVQQGKNPVAGGHAVHGHVEERAQLPHGQEELGGEQQDGKAPGKAYLAGQQLNHGQGDAQSGAAVGHQVHDGDRVELHGEHLHGDAAEGLGLTVHLLVAGLVGLVDLQGGQTLEIFQKGVPQGGVLAPVLA